MGVSTTQSTREPGSISHTTTKQHREELDIEHVLTQLTLEEKISLTAGRCRLVYMVMICADMM